MRVLIVCATSQELKPVAEQLRLTAHNRIGGLSTSQFNQHQISLLITGPGILQSAYHLSTELASSEYDLCIQAGIAGSFVTEIQKGEVVNVISERLGQAGAEDGDAFLDLFELDLLDKNQFPFEQGIIINPHTFIYPVLGSLRQVSGLTVETAHGNAQSIQRVIVKYQPSVESMEGASFFYACRQHQIPFIELRSISNYVEKRDKSNWNIPLAVEQLNKVLYELITQL